jgi:peptidyl-prolyl cis-trans isomerase D
VFSGNAYTNAISIDDKAVESDYNAHKQDYAIPEQVRVQYVVLSADSIRSGIEISDQAAQQFYDANKAKFSEPEQRRASHILIKADSSMSAADKAAAKAKAEKLYQELRANPARFAELAKQDSQDPGSAAQGGDLGSFTRDTMVKPFADAAFSMKVGELRGPVESEFGYHIIRLDGIAPGKVAPFASVKPGIVAQLAQQEAERKFAEAAEKFSNMVYEQSDSLDPAAKQFHLNVQESGWISRDHAIPAFLAKTDLMDAVFGQDSLEKHQNTEAIEVAPNMLVSARVLEHKPSGTRPLSEVAGEIRAKLAAQAARAKAIEAGQQALKMAQTGQAVTGLGAPMTISRMQPLNLPAESIKAIFAANASKLPTSVGVETPDGYRLYRITKVASVPPDATRLTQLQHDLTGIVMKEEIKAYLAYVKAKAGVKINDAILEKKAE